MKLVITGASGYIGGHLVTQAFGRGHAVVAASRRPPLPPVFAWMQYELDSPTAVELPSGTNAVIHLATNTSSVHGVIDELDLMAARSLVAATRQSKAKIVFVSSQTARPDAPTTYGRTKWRIEQEVLSAGGWVVRPGQVYGGELRGLFGVMVKIVSKLPLLPAFLPAPMVQPIHVDDLTEGLLRIVERDDLPSGVYCLASPEPVSFAKFLDEIAQSRLRRRRIFVPAPVVAINAVVRVLGEGLRTRLRLERLQSLFDLPVMTTAADLKQLGVVLRPLRSGMHPSGNDRRRRLLREGQALLTYVLKEPASGALLRRYVRAMEKLRDGSVLDLPSLFVNCPALLALIDAGGGNETAWRKEFLWRLDGATILAEATPLGARRFLGLGYRNGFVRSFVRMTYALMSEIGWRIIGTLSAPIVRLLLPRALTGCHES